VHNGEGAKVSWLSLENERGERVIEWRHVVLAEAFKRDLFAVDLICLHLGLDDDGTVEISEEMPGWESLVKRLPSI
jgi:hypothetical protein